TQEEYAFGVDKNQPELLEEANKFIAQINSDGTFEQILNNYFGDGEPKAVSSAELDSSKDQLVVATNAAFEPFEYMLGDKYYGIDMEIAALFAEHLGKELVISNMDFDAVCLSVGQGKADIAMAGLTIKEDRKQYVTFTDKYYDAAQRIIVKATDTTFDDCKTAADVEAILSKLDKNTKIGVQTGTTGQFYVEGDEEWGFRGYNVTCVGYKSGSLAVQDMLNGNIDFVIIDEAPAQCIARAINKLN
ncbi:MAG: transporter substrate-binding domain-containing protein, partial [Clostridia bacterium]|nr:transporter substrate-binding domain-containing protein [Clostridia bacterium]